MCQHEYVNYGIATKNNNLIRIINDDKVTHN